MSALRTYLSDPFLAGLYEEIRKVGPLRSISLDLTDVCNLRCKGCYFFEEGMDRVSASDDEALDRLIESERARGTNFVTIVGGEPSLVVPRIRKVYENFKASIATNGLEKIPMEGLEKLPIGISVWGDHQTDASLRGNGKRDLFDIALHNYRNDPRAFWYYTVAPGNAHEIERVVSACIENGNPVLFNYYSDLSGLGGQLDFRQGFEDVRSTIDRMIQKYPGWILMTPYFNQVISSGRMQGEDWGYEVCTNLSADFEPNLERFTNGSPYNMHFRAYNSDFETTRRCCTGIDRSCDSCFDTWEHFSWIMINLRKHLGRKVDFANWLATTYLFYHISGLTRTQRDAEVVAGIQHYLASLDAPAQVPAGML